MDICEIEYISNVITVVIIAMTNINHLCNSVSDRSAERTELLLRKRDSKVFDLNL